MLRCVYFPPHSWIDVWIPRTLWTQPQAIYCQDFSWPLHFPSSPHVFINLQTGRPHVPRLSVWRRRSFDGFADGIQGCNLKLTLCFFKIGLSRRGFSYIHLWYSIYVYIYTYVWSNSPVSPFLRQGESKLNHLVLPPGRCCWWNLSCLQVVTAQQLR